MSTIPVPADMDRNSPMSTSEIQHLAMLESTIKNGLKICWKVGEALAEIRNRRLYRQEYDNFEEYCLKKWNFSRPRAYQLIMSAEVMSDLSEAVVGQGDPGQLDNNSSTMVDKHTRVLIDALRGMNERQVRELAKLPHEKRIAAFEAAATIAHNKNLTAKDIKKAAEEVGLETVKPKPTAQPEDLIRHAPKHKLDRSRLPVGPKPTNALQARENDILEAMNNIFIYRLWRKAGFNSFAEYVGDFQGRLLATYAEFIVNNDEEDYKG